MRTEYLSPNAVDLRNGGKPAAALLIQHCKISFGIAWSSFNFAIQDSLQFWRASFPKVLSTSTSGLRLYGLDESPPLTPVETASITSNGNSRLNIPSNSNSSTSPCVCWEPCSILRFNSSTCFSASVSFLSFSASFSLCCCSNLEHTASSISFSLRRVFWQSRVQDFFLYLRARVFFYEEPAHIFGFLKFEITFLGLSPKIRYVGTNSLFGLFF